MGFYHNLLENTNRTSIKLRTLNIWCVDKFFTRLLITFSVRSHGMQAWRNNAPFCYRRPHAFEEERTGGCNDFYQATFCCPRGRSDLDTQEELHFLAQLNELFTHSHIFSVGASSRPFSDQISSVVTRQETRNASPRFLSFDLHEWTSDTFTFLSRCSCECARIRLHSFEWERKWAPHLDIGASARVYLIYYEWPRLLYMQIRVAFVWNLGCWDFAVAFLPPQVAFLIPAGWTGPGIRLRARRRLSEE